MDIQDILNHLPHRYPFLLVDKIVEFHKGKSLVALKNVTINEPYFTGHFPNRPVMPGVLILEALAQASCLLANKSTEDDKPLSNYLYLFAGIENARFKRIVEPGDQLMLKVELLRYKQGVWKFSGVATVDGEVACTTEIVSAKKEIKK